MKRILLACTAIVGTMGIASAADLPSRKGPAVAPVYAPVFTWTGFYVGVNAGYVWGNGDTLVNQYTGVALIGSGVLGSYGTKPEGFIGGGQIGYNYQMGQFVIGAEADIQFADAKKDVAWAGSIGGVPGYAFAATGELNYLGTVRARLGFAVDRALLYVTGGLAYGEAGGSAYLSGPAGAYWAGSGSATKTGWTLGAGVEYAFTNNLTARIEYLYYDLGNTTYTSGVFGGDAFSSRVENTGNVVRAGLNWKFGSAAPGVMANY